MDPPLEPLLGEKRYTCIALHLSSLSETRFQLHLQVVLSAPEQGGLPQALAAGRVWLMMGFNNGKPTYHSPLSALSYKGDLSAPAASLCLISLLVQNQGQEEGCPTPPLLPVSPPLGGCARAGPLLEILFL